LLCKADIGYQRYRRVVRNRVLQQLFLALPLHRRRQLAARLRERTQAAVRRKAATAMDVDAAAAQSLLRRFAAQWLIHGHTHRPAIHRLDSTDKGRLRIDLGDWYREGRGLWVDAHGPHPFTLTLRAIA
ncbi:MAG: UDP-2,3-diacylglucosamine diphosphatase, partial [Candidatus Macondimonas sp.]